MKYKHLYNSSLKLSEIGLGCASYWGKKQFSEKKAVSVVHKAIDLGVNYFDTGHSYSAGHAEIRLGKALTNHTNVDLIVSSKVGTRLGNYGRLVKDFTPKWIKQSCELSLKQLKLDHLPVFFLHGPNPEDFNPETYQALDELRVAGKIGLVGVNSFDDHIIELSALSHQFDCVMLDYNIFTQHRLATIQLLTQQNINVMVAGGLGGALFKTGFNRITSFKKLWYWLRAVKNNRQQKSIAPSFDFLNHQEMASAIQIALAFVLRVNEVSSTLVGTTSDKHLLELVEATELKIPEFLVEQIKALA